MSIIKKHPYSFSISIFGILFLIGWIMSHDNPATALMIFSGIGAFITYGIAFTDLNEKNS